MWLVPALLMLLLAATSDGGTASPPEPEPGDTGAQSVDPGRLRRLTEDLASRSAPIRRRAASALIEIGNPAVPALEEILESDPRRAELAGDVLDEIVWGVDLRQREPRSSPPDAELLDVGILGELGMPDRAARNPLLLAALERRMRRRDEVFALETGETDPLLGALHELDRLRATEDVPYDELETRAKRLFEAFPSREAKGRIRAMVAHVYGQSGCRPRTVYWARRALRDPIPPEWRLRMYEYWYSATLLQHGTAARRSLPEVRRKLIRPALFALREALRYDLPHAAPDLPGVGIPRDDTRKARRAHRRAVQARVVAEFLREMVRFREIHERRVVKHCAVGGASRKELADRLGDPAAVDALLDALRSGEDLGDGLAILERQAAEER